MWVFVVWVWLVLFHLETSERFLIKVWHTYRKCTSHKCTNLRISTNWTHATNTQIKKETITTIPKPFIETPKGQHCADFEQHSFAYLLTFYQWNHAACIPVWHLLLSIMFVRVICTVVTLYSWPWTMGLNCASPLIHGFFQ